MQEIDYIVIQLLTMMNKLNKDNPILIGISNSVSSLSLAIHWPRQFNNKLNMNVSDMQESFLVLQIKTVDT